jgi:2C-methyl-D-erythritol 2,4-cyclodiphosphate synthase
VSTFSGEGQLRQISQYVAGKSEEINNVVAKVENQIEKLTEYRQALITSAATGKIRVT